MRSHYCGHVTEANIDQEVTLCGWANRRRDHGGVIFVDLRDREGLVQVVFDPDREDMFATAERIRNEYVLRVTGRAISTQLKFTLVVGLIFGGLTLVFLTLATAGHRGEGH